MTRRMLFMPATDPASGMGHARRSLMLADALSGTGADCIFAVPDGNIAALVDAHGHVRSEEPAGDVDAVIGDDYSLDMAWCRAWGARGAVRVLIDDLADRDMDVELAINQNIYGSADMYRGFGARRVLAGLDYCMIDPAFARVADRRSPGAVGIVFGFGGTENGEAGMQVAMRLMARLPDMHFHIVASPLRPPSPDAGAFAAVHSGRVTLHHGPDVARVMESCTLFVGAFGSMVWEAYAAGLRVAGCVTAENQRLVARALAARGVPVIDGFDLDALADAAAILAGCGGHKQQIPVIDGNGSRRVAEAINQACEERALLC